MAPSGPNPFGLYKLVAVAVVTLCSDWSYASSSYSKWQLLNKTTSVKPDEAACAAIQANYTSANYRANLPNAWMNNQDEMCSSVPLNQCLLDNTKPTDPLAFANGAVCNQGMIPPVYLEVRSPEDVIAAFEFANCTGTKIAIKNSGHDYLTRSSGVDRLLLWMRSMQQLSYNNAFVPEGCPASETNNAITAGAGVNMDQAFAFAEQHDMTFIGAYAATVGVSGGWVQAGGHSVLSPVYGLGIDRVLEFKIVTPDGVYRTANACQNQDLFWALRGGGGGSFGVVLETSHRVEPLIPLVVAAITIPATATTFTPWFEIMVNNSLTWSQQGWGGHITPSSLIDVNPLLTLDEAKESMAPAVAFAEANNGSVVFEEYPSYYPFYLKYVGANELGVGNVHIAGSRLIPQSLFETETGRSQLMQYIQAIHAQGSSPYIPVVGPVLYNYTTNSTSATPAWREALWELGAGASWAWNSTLSQRQAAVAKLNNLTSLVEQLTPGGGAYQNEASPFTGDWQEAWWGAENYASLLAIKNKYDPKGLLSCYKCVGWSAADETNSCFAAFADSQ
ncbi:isoamyl alcohol oxidase, putative [Talaromyces stipitatus ATCC 10500]|uniref:Isoamyl alcohol oxidase, putative n=1 Tax=Talaromyces stipitatus (strain ATCC 10500 / CBS 375.48 / QM 6759 / NRRL 1006) TaxID=441959 RepID=B8MML6_TALSN|nr:isoamyl alcohol oxidase, putative [Talaromyces stipitatus ATCC 10500]EED13770.1 isoamyl alcohol oxidase, putative [Talaromyces stipitatus ATCC 10500]